MPFEQRAGVAKNLQHLVVCHAGKFRQTMGPAKLQVGVAELQHQKVRSDPFASHPESRYQAGGHPGGLDRQYAHKISLVLNPANDTFYLYYCAVGKAGTPGNKGRCIGLLTSRKLPLKPE